MVTLHERRDKIGRKERCGTKSNCLSASTSWESLMVVVAIQEDFAAHSTLLEE